MYIIQLGHNYYYHYFVTVPFGLYSLTHRSSKRLAESYAFARKNLTYIPVDIRRTLHMENQSVIRFKGYTLIILHYKSVPSDCKWFSAYGLHEKIEQYNNKTKNVCV